MRVLQQLVGGLTLMVISSFGVLSRLEAHPFHTTTAEMEYNSDSGRFEVTVRMLASDLEAALTQQRAFETRREAGSDQSPELQVSQASPRVTLDKTPQIERMVAAYLNDHFFLITRDGSPLAERTGGSGVGAKIGLNAIRQDVVWPPDALRIDEQLPQQSAGQLNDANVQSTLHWAGMELNKSSAWLYFELEPPSTGDWSLTNKLLFELNAQQINTCTLRTAVSKISLRTDVRQPQVALPPQTLSR